MADGFKKFLFLESKVLDYDECPLFPLAYLIRLFRFHKVVLDKQNLTVTYTQNSYLAD